MQDFLRILLAVDMIALAATALCYLHERQISRQDYFRWALLAFMIPILGPFLVILSRPGMPRRRLRADRYRPR